ncbi:LysE family translocator [Luteimonas sp. 3794]|uniref:LysE family translocator n=1 Tax=Luteimonas sp. 3794 TaxID=2817730 RepID=UPI002864E44D|nr:LysE family translocator [Luteimonas sp. 3794]MDR6990707.1 threonine/homoserine/homoserine lactone efflux protein [Luteimonas sp. 3794]
MDWLGFALAVLLVEITPGPNMAWLISLTLADGRRAGLLATAGVAIGLALNAALSSLGLSALLVNVPAITTWVGVGAGLMMLWLAWRGWQATTDSSSAVVAGRATHRVLWAGVAINLLNAKAALFFLTVVPRFLSGPDAPLREILLLGLISVGVATLVHLGLVLCAGRLRDVLTRPDRVGPVRRVLALGMVGVACWFFYSALG